MEKEEFEQKLINLIAEYEIESLDVITHLQVLVNAKNLPGGTVFTHRTLKLVTEDQEHPQLRWLSKTRFIDQDFKLHVPKKI